VTGAKLLLGIFRFLVPVVDFPGDARVDSLLNQRPLEFGDGTEKFEYHPPDRRRRTNTFRVRNEIDAKRPEFFERMQQVGHGPTEAVRAPDKHPVELALPGVPE
jgi:hypothetical protein